MAMIEMLQIDQLLASLGGAFVGALCCWLVLSWRQPQPRRSRPTYAYTETPAITAAAQTTSGSWSEADEMLDELHDFLKLLPGQQLQTTIVTELCQAQETLQRLQQWHLRQKRSVPAGAGLRDRAATLSQRAAEDELVLQWLNEKPAARLEVSEPSRNPGAAATAPELALTQIASELLPFNPVAVRLTGKTAEAQMSATVERLEKLLASVDPPSSLGSVLPGSMISAATHAVRDPQNRLNAATEEMQRRRSDQAIIYDTLLRRCLGADDFAWRMLHKFPSRCRKELDSIVTEIRRRAWTTATRRITQLRGMAANIAADNLRDALANLEHVCRQQSATRADQLLAAVQQEFQQVLDFIARADGICPLPERREEDHRPLAHWPAELKNETEDYLTLEM